MSSDVEVTGCRNCEVYVMRVVDGPVLLTDCSDCKLVVASQQFQAKRCRDCSFGIYSVTGPTLSESSGIEISPWSGIEATREGGSVPLDSSANQFLNVYDASEPRSEPGKPAQDNLRNFVVRFDPVLVKVLGVRRRGDSCLEESLMVSSKADDSNEPNESNESKAGVANGGATGGFDIESGSIKAIKMCEDATWQKTLDLIDMSNNNNKHLARFKSVLLSMATQPELDGGSDATGS